MKQWTEEQRREVATMLLAGFSAGQIAMKVGRSRCAVISLVNRWPDLKAIGFARSRAA